MPTYYAPGQRKGNKQWIARGRINGQQYEVVAKKAKNKRDAKAHWTRFAASVSAGDTHQESEVSFVSAATAYMDYRPPRKAEEAFIDRLVEHFDGWEVAEIGQHDIAVAANDIYPGRSNATKNRQAYAPMSYILNYAAENGWRSHIRVKKLPERKVAKRRPVTGTEQALLAATGGDEHLLLTVLFRQGWRITETLNLTWDMVDIEARIFWLHIGKADAEKPIPMHDDVFVLLANQTDKRGRVFKRWSGRDAVSKWLRPLCERIKVRFTAHMARHEWASARNEDGATASDLVAGGSWTSPRSVEPYTSVNIEHARNVVNRSETRGKMRG
jgi:integrase